LAKKPFKEQGISSILNSVILPKMKSLKIQLTLFDQKLQNLTQFHLLIKGYL